MTVVKVSIMKIMPIWRVPRIVRAWGRTVTRSTVDIFILRNLHSRRDETRIAGVRYWLLRSWAFALQPWQKVRNAKISVRLIYGLGWVQGWVQQPWYEVSSKAITVLPKWRGLMRARWTHRMSRVVKHGEGGWGVNGGWLGMVNL